MISTIIFSFVCATFSLTVSVNSQTCENVAQYSSCSFNSSCGCLPLPFSNRFGICGSLTASCSQFVPCQTGSFACEPQHICVRHTRCDSRPLCYPMSMANERVCPPIIVSNYSSALTSEDGSYIRPGSTTSGHYYEAIQIIADTTGTYIITSSSGMDTHGFLYNGTFSPSNPSTNLILRDDDGGVSNQFKLTAVLQAGVPYTVVISTHGVRVTGIFSVTATGPGNVSLNRINVTS